MQLRGTCHTKGLCMRHTKQNVLLFIVEDNILVRFYVYDTTRHASDVLLVRENYYSGHPRHFARHAFRTVHGDCKTSYLGSWRSIQIAWRLQESVQEDPGRRALHVVRVELTTSSHILVSWSVDPNDEYHYLACISPPMTGGNNMLPAVHGCDVSEWHKFVIAIVQLVFPELGDWWGTRDSKAAPVDKSVTGPTTETTNLAFPIRILASVIHFW